MLKSLKTAALAASLAVTSMVATPAAEARDGRRDHHGDDAALAIGAGVVGLAIGAAIASNRNDRYYRYPRGYYYDNYYYQNYPDIYYRNYRDYRPHRNYRPYRNYRNNRYYRDNRGWRGDRHGHDRPHHRGYNRGGWGY